jgi:hypothetical protein
MISADFSAGTPVYASMLAAPPQSAASLPAASQAPAPLPAASEAPAPQVTLPPQAPMPRARSPQPGVTLDEAPEERSAGSTLVPLPAEPRAPPASAATVTLVPSATVEAVPAVPAEATALRSTSASEASAARRDRSTLTAQPTARVVIYSPADDAAADARARVLRGRLEARGEFYVDLRYVTTFDSVDNIRFFFEADRDSATIARDRVAGAGSLTIRDFSGQSPLPSPGTIELWLASTPDDRGPRRSGALLQ